MMTKIHQDLLIISYNLNKSLLKLDNLDNIIKTYSPDILHLQETPKFMQYKNTYNH